MTNERQKFLKTSGLAKLLGVDHLLPEVSDLDTWTSPAPKKIGIFTMKAQYKGRSKPLRYLLDEKKEDD